MPFADKPGVDAWAAIADTHHAVFWLDEPQRPQANPPLEGFDSADIVVVGGGFSGLWTALRAKERDPGLDVVLLEGDRIAHAASGRNGGFVAASLTHGDLNGLDRWPQEFSRLHAMGITNLGEIKATIDRYGIECDFELTGELDVATEEYQVDELRERVQRVQAFGGSLQELSGQETRELIASPTYLAGVLDPDVATVNPARLAWGLARACTDLGVRIYEQSPVDALERSGARMVVRTDRGHVSAARVALTTAAHKPLLRRISAYVVPVFDHVVVTEPLADDLLAELVWSGRQGVGDSGNQFHYYRLTADNRILWGGYDAVYARGQRPGSSLERDDFLTARLVQHMYDTFPQIVGTPISHTWAGAIDTCSRFSAFWGTAYSGQVAYVAGYTGLGVGASRFGAEVLIDLLTDRDTERTRLAMVGSKPLPFPPEPARQWVIDWTRASLARADAENGHRNLWLRTLDRLGLGFDS